MFFNFIIRSIPFILKSFRGRNINIKVHWIYICSLSIDPSSFYNLQSHGFEQLVTFSNLKSLGIVTEQETGSQAGTPLNKVASGMAAMTRRSTFQSLCKKLSLVSIFKTGNHRGNVQKSSIQNIDHSTSKARKISVLESSYDTGTHMTLPLAHKFITGNFLG